MSVFEAISIMIAFYDLQFTILVFIFLYISNRKIKPSTNFDKSDGLFLTFNVSPSLKRSLKHRVPPRRFFFSSI